MVDAGPSQGMAQALPLLKKNTGGIAGLWRISNFDDQCAVNINKEVRPCLLGNGALKPGFQLMRPRQLQSFRARHALVLNAASLIHLRMGSISNYLFPLNQVF